MRSVSLEHLYILYAIFGISTLFFTSLPATNKKYIKIKWTQNQSSWTNWVNFFLTLSFFAEQNLSSTITAVNNITPCPLRAPLVVIIVGLPCRGKSLAAHRIARHLCWKGEFAKGNHNISICLCFSVWNNMHIAHDTCLSTLITVIIARKKCVVLLRLEIPCASSLFI